MTFPIKIVTGTGVVEGENGVFEACSSRTHLCGFACCKFGTIGNWISLLPGEMDRAQSLGLSTDHLNPVAKDGVIALNCTRPCDGKDLKPLDCQFYPLWPSNMEVTEFIVATNTKCPIPYELLKGRALWVQRMAFEWERLNPGSIAVMVKSAGDFVAYQPFPYTIKAGEVVPS